MQRNSGWELKILAIGAIVTAIAFCEPLLFPMLLAFLLYLLFNPVFDWLVYLKIPRVFASAMIVLFLLGLISFGISSLMGPAFDWIDHAPANIRVVEKKIISVKQSLQKLMKVAEKAQAVSEVASDNKIKVTAEEESLTYSLFTLTSNAIFLIFSVLMFLFFYLIYFRAWIQNIEKAIFHRRKIHEDNQFIVSLKNKVSHYMLLFTLICTGLGAAVALAMWFLGLPNPLLWGLMAMLLTYIPYVGHLMGIIVITFVSLVTFNSYTEMLAPPIVYLILAGVEGQIVTPILLGNRLNLNPLIVFFNIFFWGWFWGVAGIVISVPLLVTIKLVLENIPQLEKYKIILEK